MQKHLIDRMILRKAIADDLPQIMKLLSEAAGAQRAMGFTQWADGYPSAEIIKSDIAGQHGYLMLDNDSATAGYAALYYTDTEYERLRHIWLRRGSYGVIHRIALDDTHRGKGLSKPFLDMLEDEMRQHGAKVSRIDTGEHNKPMLHILQKRGYNNLGVQKFVWGRRIALEKSL